MSTPRPRFPKTPLTALATGLVFFLGACGGSDAGSDAGSAPLLPTWDEVRDTTHRVGSIGGLLGPEAVRFDPDQDVWFVGNMNGPGGERDANGFISRVSAETLAVEVLRFAEGTPEHPLHAPRGMALAGDTLWVADVDGVHGFHRGTGESLAFVDLTSFDPGFLNDVAVGPDGALYVTDTGRSAVYRVAGGVGSLALADSVLGNPNGITWDPARELFVLVPWEAGHPVHGWRPGEAPQPLGPSTTPGRLDGVEPVGRRLVVASQSDSALVVMDEGTLVPFLRTPGRPADIGVDIRRGRVAVPYIALDRVDVWTLPPK